MTTTIISVPFNFFIATGPPGRGPPIATTPAAFPSRKRHGGWDYERLERVPPSVTGICRLSLLYESSWLMSIAARSYATILKASPREAFGGGVKRISATIYEEVRYALKDRLKTVCQQSMRAHDHFLIIAITA
ncbi:hypothetical protein E4T50_00044 [Aureobasidium sp. EXF-12298]|nr:hypothetical protein E4T50_00044 [Aureobasidium sp. EXF-12298]KAI4759314.1 hypothetical protein E4T51_07666 [Aureobasidium sp. EXF-12344]KAI4783007.1 hypothetical protein E4T52_02025 [Aureobasidium sp. EXF-3400]